MRRILLIMSCVALAAPSAIVAAQQADAASAVLGRWRIVRAADAPWVRHPRDVSPNPRWIGQIVTFTPAAVDGPGALRCGHARYTATSLPADALFGSAFTAPTADAAALGMMTARIAGTRVRCDSGVLDFHRVDDLSMLFARGDVLYTLNRSAGAFAPDTSPAGVVQRLLEHHFAGGRAFNAARLASNGPWLTTRLREQIAAYLATPPDESQVPAINGDPFTDSQEPPVRFWTSLGAVKGDVATVPVRFSFGRRTRGIDFVLRRERGKWLVSDLLYPRRGSLVALLR